MNSLNNNFVNYLDLRIEMHRVNGSPVKPDGHVQIGLCLIT